MHFQIQIKSYYNLSVAIVFVLMILVVFYML